MEEKAKKSLLLKIKKAQWQLNSVNKMIEDWKDCIDIVNQNMAVIWLLKSAQQDLLRNHLNKCFNEWSSNPKNRGEMTDELIKVFNYYNKG